MTILLHKYTQVVVSSIIIQPGITNQQVMEWGVLEMPLKPAGLLVPQRWATPVKVLQRESIWFLEGELKSQSQEAGGSKYKLCHTLKT